MLSLKLLQWRPKNQAIFCISRLITHSFCNDTYEYDPPFSPVSKPKETQHRKTNHKPKKAPTRRPLKSDLPFHFRYSYSESSPSVEPIGFRESPKFSPFGPGRLDRKWTGTAAPTRKEPDPDMVAKERNRVIGDPLTDEEVSELIERYRHSDCSRQINLGKK